VIVVLWTPRATASWSRLRREGEVMVICFASFGIGERLPATSYNRGQPNPAGIGNLTA
jgi:hypothetical protein